MPRFRRILLATVLVAVPLAACTPATAGTYTVRQCDYASGNGHHDLVWQQAGAPTVDPHAGSGCGEFGLAVRNGGGGTQRTYPSGAYGGWFAHAPNGTVFTAFSGAFGSLEGCCVSGMAGYGEAAQGHDGAGARAYFFQGHLGNESWYAPSALRGPVGRSWSAGASGFDAKRVGFMLRCGPGFSCSQGAHADVRLRGRSFDFTLRDDSPPTVGDPGGSLLTGGWVRGVRTVTLPAGDAGAGLALVEAAFDAGLSQRWPLGCATAGGRYARLQPCPTGWSGEWAVDTARLPDGGRHLHLSATDAGGATTRRTVAAYVDNGAPAAPRDLALAGRDGWRAANRFELGWANPGGQHAPIVRARWRVCPVGADPDPARCAAGERAARDVTNSGPIELPTAGEWDVAVWLEDQAGNADAASATAPVRLRLDPDPPRLRVVPEAMEARERVAVDAEDLSGIAEGTVEVRRYGGADWTALPTERDGGRLTATLAEQLAAGGAYELRARAVDLAGNEGIADGGVRTFTGPWAERGGGATRPGDERAANARMRRARVTMAARAAMTRRDRGRQDGRARRHAGKAKARRDRVRWGASRRRLTVPGGRAVLFHGRVGGPLPRGGKLVEVQAHFRGRWRTISVVRARRGDRRWRFRYAFRAGPLRVAYRLRARVPAESGYPFAAGASRPVRVTVLPRR